MWVSASLRLRQISSSLSSVGRHSSVPRHHVRASHATAMLLLLSTSFRLHPPKCQPIPLTAVGFAMSLKQSQSAGHKLAAFPPPHPSLTPPTTPPYLPPTHAHRCDSPVLADPLPTVSKPVSPTAYPVLHES